VNVGARVPLCGPIAQYNNAEPPAEAIRLRESGIHEKLIMDIGGWKTRSMFDRYTITDPEAMRRAMEVVTAPVQPYGPQIAPDGQNTGRTGKPAIQ
jgi:NADPH-dependent curcumin reductase CurA